MHWHLLDAWWKLLWHLLDVRTTSCMMTSSNGNIFRVTGHLCGGALVFSLICVWINGWVNNREAGDLRRYGAHYDVTVMTQSGVFAHRVERSSPIVPMLRPSALRVNTETELLFWRQNDNFRCSQWPKFRQMTIRSAVKTHGILSMTLNEFACWAKRCWK